tara:strand:- start:199 stop:573 length:375 start_codon:yes stop_codon:yes gene_type:complete
MTGPATLRPQRYRGSGIPRTAGVKFEIATDPESFGGLLKAMRERSMLTTKMLAAKLGVKPASVNQYLYRKRGQGGTSTLRWFLRYAEACGCKVHISFPTEMPKVINTPGFLVTGLENNHDSGTQ